MSSSNATVATPPAFTKGASAGKSGGFPPASIAHPREQGSCLGSSKQPAYGAKKYKEYGAAAPSIKTGSQKGE